MAGPAMKIYIEVDGESVLLEGLSEQERLRINQRLQECLVEPLGYREKLALWTLFHRLPSLKKTISQLCFPKEHFPYNGVIIQ